MRKCLNRQSMGRAGVVFFCLAVFALPRPVVAEAGEGHLEFFEKRIRPLLVERCYECHSDRTGKAKGELRLDSREGILKGGESGPAISLAQPRQSLLIKAIRRDDRDLAMPPSAKDRLSPEQVADFESWIAGGAPFPKAVAPVTGQTWKQISESHWAFQPVKESPPPKVKDDQWPRTAIDRFILAKLEEKNLQPSPSADPRTLIRRATFDLHGLPPTPAEVEAFVKEWERESSELRVPGFELEGIKPGESAPSATTRNSKLGTRNSYARVIDRLLASPRYGERWGRHWLDLARYSDTKGYVYGDREERFFVHAHAYRDWVIRAFNDDLPYDRFLLLQIAGDQLLPAANADAGSADVPVASLQATKPAAQADMAAIGFLTIGRRFLGVTHDIIDDRIDTLTRTTLGLTVSCARCHDHKFDPIPTDDYYSLYGVFMNTTERTVPLATALPDTDAARAFEKELRSRQAKLRDAFAGKRREWSDRVRAMSTDYLLALLATDKLWTEEFYAFVQPHEVNPPFVRQWQSYLHRRNQAGFDAVFEPWHRLMKLPAASFATEAPPILAQLLSAKESPLNARVAASLSATTLGSMEDLARMYGKLLVEVDKTWRELVKKDASAAALPDDADEALRQVLYAHGSPVLVPDRSIYEAEFFFDEGTRVQLAKLQAQIDQWLIQAPGATPHAVILEDLPATSMRTARVFRRGNPALPGNEVQRQFLELLEGDDRKAFEHGAGRLELARAIVDPANPLTARVMVNRIWQHHFAAGLVATPSDFGTRAATPSHPQLLDHLATQFVRSGWSIKAMHKAIMTSAVYMQGAEGQGAEAQQASQSRAALIDPTNELLWHFPRRRLDFESMRDAMLFVTGELDGAMGGRPVDLFRQPFTTKRSVYGLVDRQFFPGELRIFDVASPDLHSPTRPITTIPQQALFFMNSAFVKDRAKAMAKRINAAGGFASIAAPGADPSVNPGNNPPSEAAIQKGITDLYQHLYQRSPAADELALGVRFIRTMQAQDRMTPPPARPKPSAWVYGYGELDEKAGRVKTFEKLPHFTGEAWQGGPAWPDAKLGWVQLTAEGGHAGNTLAHAAIRRWVAPRDMTISIVSTIRHEREAGDGIRAFIVHGREGKKGEAGEQGGEERSEAASGVVASWVLHNQTVESNIAALKVRAGDTVDFIVDIRGNLNSDDYIWKPVITQVKEPLQDVKDVKDDVQDVKLTSDAADQKETWSSHAEFAGVISAPPAPLSAWEMYAQALMLVNEFMFVD